MLKAMRGRMVQIFGLVAFAVSGSVSFVRADAPGDTSCAVPPRPAWATPAPSIASLRAGADPDFRREVELGRTARKSSRDSEALPHFAAALSIADRLGDATASGLVAWEIESLADAAQRRPDLNLAIAAFTILAAESRVDAYRAFYARAIGNAQAGLGKYADAFFFYHAALDADKSAGRDAAADLSDVAAVELRLGRTEDAMQHYQASLNLNIASRDCSAQARTLRAMATVSAILNRYRDAVDTVWAALAVFRRTVADPNPNGCDVTTERVIDTEPHDRWREAPYFEEIAEAELRLEHYDRALACARTALADFHAPRTGPAANAFTILHGAAWDGIWDHEGYARALTTIAEAQNLLGRHVQARTKALSAAAIERANDLPAWEALRTAASADSSLVSDEPDTRHCKNSATQLYDAAIDDIDRVQSTLTNEERSVFSTRTLAVYDEFSRYLLRLDDSRHNCGVKAFDVFERRQSRTLVEQLAQNVVRSFARVPQDLIDGERALAVKGLELRLKIADAQSAAKIDKNNILGLQTELTQTEIAQDRLESYFRDHKRDYYALRHPKPADLSAARAKLDRDEVLLVYQTLRPKSALWVIRHDGFALFQIPGTDELQRDVTALRRHLTVIPDAMSGPDRPTKAAEVEARAAADLPRFAVASHRLYLTVLPEGARSRLGANTRLIVVPTGPLFDVPFEAFVTDATAPRKPRYLLERYPISYAASASALALVRNGTGRSRASRSLLAFAHATPGTFSAAKPVTYSDFVVAAMSAAARGGARGDSAWFFPPLPGTLVEANATLEALHGSLDDLQIDDEASRAQVLHLNETRELQRYRYILFATHAVLPDEIDGLTQPAIVLAHPERGDAFLTMADILGLTVRADFVALSACNTGGGPRAGGEGVSGLTRAFLYAGAPAISVTLWSVDDLAPPKITPQFFAAMARGVAPAQALQRAKQTMLKAQTARSRHPSAWAPTVIFGDGDHVSRIRST
jgi:CHAT domain-containing protein/tetratricopeptide (TPR) repeat protein